MSSSRGAEDNFQQPEPENVGRDGAGLPPIVIHARGAALSWPSYVSITGDPANDLAAYEVHRGTSSGFTPSAATLVATVNAHDTSFVDTDRIRLGRSARLALGSWQAPPTR